MVTYFGCPFPRHLLGRNTRGGTGGIYLLFKISCLNLDHRLNISARQYTVLQNSQFDSLFEFLNLKIQFKIKASQDGENDCLQNEI